MHGTTGSGGGFFNPPTGPNAPGSLATFAAPLFGAAGPLSAATHYIVLPDAVGHGLSSKPSDGERMRFPKYTYDDMCTSTYRLLTEHLGVDHLKLAMGTSMGGMLSWVWGCTKPLLPMLPSLPTTWLNVPLVVSSGIDRLR